MRVQYSCFSQNCSIVCRVGAVASLLRGDDAWGCELTPKVQLALLACFLHGHAIHQAVFSETRTLHFARTPQLGKGVLC